MAAFEAATGSCYKSFMKQKKAARSATYALFAQAMRKGQQVLCLYDGHARELCPILLGHSKGEEVALVYQFAGASRSRLPDWKCLRLAKASAVRLRDGPLYKGSSHQRAQSCVEVVDLDINPESPYRPRRRLGDVS